MLPLLALAGIGQVAGALLSKQKAPPTASYTPVSVADEQARTIAGNLANFDQAALLSEKTNAFDQSQALALMEKALPGFGALQKRLLASVDADLNAQTSLPADVQDRIARFAAEKGIARGTGGNFNAFNLVKDFGFNLLDWQQAARARALNTLSTVYGLTPKVNVMSPSAMLVDPRTAIQVAGQNNEMQYHVAQAGYNAQTAARNANAAMLGGALQTASMLPLSMALAQTRPGTASSALAPVPASFSSTYKMPVMPVGLLDSFHPASVPASMLGDIPYALR